MALSASDFTEPDGELRADMFPGVDDLEASGGYLETWISDAQSELSNSSASLTTSEEDDAKEAWVYYRAYKSVWLRLTTNPHQADLDDGGSLKYTDQQVQNFKELADQYREDAEALLGETTETQGPEVRSQTKSSTTRWV